MNYMCESELAECRGAQMSTDFICVYIYIYVIIIDLHSSAYFSRAQIWNETVLFCSDFALVSAENIWKAAKNCCELCCADFSECAVACRFLQLRSELVFTGLQPRPEQGFGWAWPGLLGLGLAGLRAFKWCQACKSLTQDKYYMKGESRTYI